MTTGPLGVDRFAVQLAELEQQLAGLAQTESPNPTVALLKDALTELSTTVEELRVAEEELRQQADELAAANDLIEAQRRHYLDLFDAAPEGYLVTDSNGLIREANHAAGHLFRRPPEKLRGKPLALYVRPDRAAEFRHHLALAATAKEPVTWDTGLRRPANETCEVTCHVAAIRRPGTDELLELRWFLHDVTARKQAEAEAETARQRLAQVATRMEAVREEERRRIAQAVHDEIGAALTAIKIDVSQVRQGLEVLGPGRAGGAALLAHADGALQLIDKTVQTVRRISMEMRPAILDEFGLVAALDWQLTEFGKRTGIQCKFNVRPGRNQVPAPIATAVFRVLQEVLTNVVRHAHATRVHVRLYENERGLVLTVHDNGRGMDTTRVDEATSMGVLGMRERVRPFGGTVNFASEPGEGTLVHLRIPLESRAPPSTVMSA